MSDPGLRVLVVGDQRRAVARGFCAELEAAGVEVCAVVGDAASAVDTAREQHPDACVVDARAEPDALATVTAVAAAATDVPVVVLGTEPTDRDLLRALTAGASGYLSGRTPQGRLEPTLRDAVSGRSAFPRRLDGILLAAMRRSMSADPSDE